MELDRVRDAYAARAADYVAAVGRIEHAAESDRLRVRDWARQTAGPHLDVGCGPGQWTHFLHEAGVDIEGVDPVPEFIALASDTYPGVRYRVGRAEELGMPERTLGGVLAWFSLIHTEPHAIDEALSEFSRVLRVGGSLLLGFFAGSPERPFAHAVAPAYYWTIAALTERLERAEFRVVRSWERAEPGARPVGAIVAQVPRA
ncbi:class I SAM-dependent methyltransferase [Leucobacter luti]|uniref:Methyltransferase family protein n=1 Tax=Leucobacter luti TaxID=340320 RepID=A0A4Q7TYB1_9MICO|nr:class I SAM-dependent methyltransferase [Leucobacter luti]MBL3698807.1 class I SAM-dependent methyltransferase [Leucobacter luti]RZT66184.1 methyltransferase family protein [Leucobacter luti]